MVDVLPGSAATPSCSSTSIPTIGDNSSSSSNSTAYCSAQEGGAGAGDVGGSCAGTTTRKRPRGRSRSPEMTHYARDPLNPWPIFPMNLTPDQYQSRVLRAAVANLPQLHLDFYAWDDKKPRQNIATASAGSGARSRAGSMSSPDPAPHPVVELGEQMLIDKKLFDDLSVWQRRPGWKGMFIMCLKVENHNGQVEEDFPKLREHVTPANRADWEKKR
ncbi:unnamed protein product, partial [Amoebophrya sp. A25]|eukprot:GSA25T00002688001.1